MKGNKFGRGNKGKKRTDEQKKNYKNSKIGEKNPQWKGDKVSYSALHQWVGRNLKKTDKCMIYKKQTPYDVANISGKYKRNLSDWEWLCRRCHMQKDNRIFNLKQYANLP